MGKDVRMAEEEDDLKSEKREKLGELCASLGLEANRMTDRMLSTIEMSKDIERNQRDVIKKLSSTSPREEEEEGQSIVVDDGEEMQLNTVGKSLKRRRVPPPLSISEANSTTASLQGSGGVYARSAPAHVPKFPRSSVEKRFVGKPRVLYLGRVPSGAARQDSPIQSANAYKLKTPYQSYFPGYAMPLPAMPAYAPYPYGYPGQLPLYQSTPQLYNAPMMPQWQPRSAVPYLQHHRDRRGNHQAKKAKTKETEELRGKDAESDSSNQQADTTPDHDTENADDTESAHLAIEENPRPLPSSEPRDVVLGEIRISGNVFSYEFPSQRPGIDKKMFMSICDKVWDESRRLLDDSP